VELKGVGMIGGLGGATQLLMDLKGGAPRIIVTINYAFFVINTVLVWLGNVRTGGRHKFSTG
jgi:hypothetical protein